MPSQEQEALVRGETDAPNDFLQGHTKPQTDETAAAYAADAEGEKAVEGDSLTVLRALAEELFNTERRIAKLTQELADEAKGLGDIQEKRLPDLMDRHNMPSFQFFDVTTGITHTIKREDKWRVSMPANKPENFGKRKLIFDWFRSPDIGLAGVIKKGVVAAVGTRSDEFVGGIIAKLKQEFPDLDVSVEEKIEPATLTAQVSRLKDAGKNVHEDLNVAPLRRAVVSAK